MRIRKLDPVTHRMVRLGGRYVWIEGIEALRQVVKCRLLTILGEWWLDPTIGVLDLVSGRMFGKGVSVDYIRGVLLAEILATTFGSLGIATAKITSLAQDTAERTLDLSWEGRTTTGQPISDSFDAFQVAA